MREGFFNGPGGGKARKSEPKNWFLFALNLQAAPFEPRPVFAGPSEYQNLNNFFLIFSLFSIETIWLHFLA